MTSPLIGSWCLVSDNREGIAVYTETHYSVVVMAKGRNQFNGDNPTREEMAEAYQTFWASSGTYEIAGDNVNNFTELVCRSPKDVGRKASREFIVSDDKMKDRIIPPDGVIDEQNIGRGEWRHWEKIK